MLSVVRNQILRKVDQKKAEMNSTVQSNWTDGTAQSDYSMLSVVKNQI